MGGLSVRKGKTFEREVARTLAALYTAAEERRGAAALAPAGTASKPGKAPVRRGLSQSRGGGAEEPDVVVGDLDIHVEAKHDNGISPTALMAQALRDVRQSGTPRTMVVGVLKRDRQQPEALLFAWDAMLLFALWHGWTEAPRIAAYRRAETPRPILPGPVLRPYPGVTPHPLGLTPAAREHGPVVTIPWREFLAILDAAWDYLPRKGDPAHAPPPPPAGR